MRRRNGWVKPVSTSMFAGAAFNRSVTAVFEP